MARILVSKQTASVTTVCVCTCRMLSAPVHPTGGSWSTNPTGQVFRRDTTARCSYPPLLPFFHPSSSVTRCLSLSCWLCLYVRTCACLYGNVLYIGVDMCLSVCVGVCLCGRVFVWMCVWVDDLLSPSFWIFQTSCFPFSGWMMRFRLLVHLNYLID